MWTKEETDILISLYKENETYNSIADTLNRSKAGVQKKCSDLVKSGDIKPRRANYIRWNKENTEKLINLFNSGVCYKIIADSFGCSEHSIKSRCSILGREGKIKPRGKGNHGTGSVKKPIREWDKTQDLLELVRKYKTNDFYNSSVIRDNLPPISVIRNKYGSWTEARLAAGLPESVGVQKDYIETTIYLLYFEEDQFYKIGITQRSLSERFCAYPKYEVIDLVKTSLCEAREYEKAMKAAISEYQYSPSHPKFYKENKGGAGGHTECFKPKETILTLEDVFELRR